MDHPLYPQLTRFNNLIRRFNDKHKTGLTEDGVLFNEDAVVVGLFVPVASLSKLDEFESIVMNTFHLGEDPRVIHHSQDGLTIDYVLH